MIDTVALKLRIIDLATSGALSSYDENDESIESLLVNLPEPSKKRKRLLCQPFEYDNLFEIPEHWKWIKLGELSSYGDTPTKIMPDEADDNTWILELEDIESGGRLIEKKRVSDKDAIGEKTAFKKNQVLYSKLRPYLKKVLVADEDGISTPELIAAEIFGGILPEYIVLCLTNSYVDRVINKRSYGVKMPRVDAGFMVNLPLPIPPLQEQQRIVQVVNSIFEHILTISELQSAYSSDLEVLKSKIIDAGIQGKLTEQLQEDGNAEDLYAVIQEEKERLIKEKKIKKSKALPEITEEEIPFEIPNNWKWVRLVDLCKQVTDGTHKTPHYTAKGIPFLSVKDISSGFIDFSDTKFISSDEHDQLLKRCKPEKSDILFCRIGTLGKAIEIDTDIQFSIFVSLGLIKPIEKRITRYLVYVLNSGYGYGWIKLHKAGDSMHAAKINLDMLRTFPVPIPPIEEMDRIVDKVNMILDMI